MLTRHRTTSGIGPVVAQIQSPAPKVNYFSTEDPQEKPSVSLLNKPPVRVSFCSPKGPEKEEIAKIFEQRGVEVWSEGFDELQDMSVGLLTPTTSRYYHLLPQGELLAASASAIFERVILLPPLWTITPLGHEIGAAAPKESLVPEEGLALTPPPVPGAVLSLLPGEAKELADSLSAIVLTRVNQDRFPVKAIQWSGYVDPEEGTAELVLTVTVLATSAQAMAFWDSVGDDIERMKEHLPDQGCALLDQHLAVEVDWSTPL